MQIKSVIIDDERRSRAYLRSLLMQINISIDLLGEADDVNSGVQSIKLHEPNLVFLDIQLRGGTGFDILAHFRDPKFKVIFITAYDQYAIEAFKVYAIDYLLKPIEQGTLETAIKKAFTEISLMSHTEQLNHLIKYLHKDHQRIIISSENAFDFVHIKDITRLEASGSYTRIFLKDGTNKMTSKGLIDYEQRLSPNGFYRVHQSHLISMDEVKSVSKASSGEVTLSDGSIVPVSRRRKEAFLKALNLFK